MLVIKRFQIVKVFDVQFHKRKTMWVELKCDIFILNNWIYTDCTLYSFCSNHQILFRS